MAAPAHVRFQKIRCREGDVPVRNQVAADAAIRDLAGLGEPDGVRRGQKQAGGVRGASPQQKATPHGGGLCRSRKGKNLTAFFRFILKAGTVTGTNVQLAMCNVQLKVQLPIAGDSHLQRVTPPNPRSCSYPTPRRVRPCTTSRRAIESGDSHRHRSCPACPACRKAKIGLSGAKKWLSK